MLTRGDTVVKICFKDIPISSFQEFLDTAKSGYDCVLMSVRAEIPCAYIHYIDQIVYIHITNGLCDIELSKADSTLFIRRLENVDRDLSTDINITKVIY